MTVMLKTIFSILAQKHKYVEISFFVIVYIYFRFIDTKRKEKTFVTSNIK